MTAAWGANVRECRVTYNQLKNHKNTLTVLQPFGTNLLVFSIRVRRCSADAKPHVVRRIEEYDSDWYILLAGDIQPVRALAEPAYRKTSEITSNWIKKGYVHVLSKFVRSIQTE